MIDWRRLTVITFHSVPTPTSMANSNQTAGHHVINPITNVVTPLVISTSQSEGPVPSRREIDDAVQPPITPPTAPPVVSTAKAVGPVSSTSWPNSTSAANVIMPK